MNSILRLIGNTVIFFTVLSGAPYAYAAAGWYLLIPPISDFDEHANYLEGYKILDNKPLSQWAQQGAYDSASECEEVKNALLMVEHKLYSKFNLDYINAISAKKEPIILEHMKHTAERTNANVDAWTASRCIKSDDLRLGK